MRLSSDPTEIEVKQSTVDMGEECALVEKALVVVVSVECNAVTRCVVFDPGGTSLYGAPQQFQCTVVQNGIIEDIIVRLELN